MASGLILFAYVTSHLINHAFGIRSVDAMRAAHLVLLKPWQTTPGLVLLYSSFFSHTLLALYALYRRRHLRIPSNEAWQLALGLLIPLLLIRHAASIRLGESAFGLSFGYERVLYRFWVLSPDFALPSQYTLLLVVWIHGCIGLRSWLRVKPWFRCMSPVLASVATLVPALAIAGFTNAGLDIRDVIAQDSSRISKYVIADSKAAATVDGLITVFLLIYAGLVGATFGLRAIRDRRANRVNAVRITYPGYPAVTVPAGFSVLETSRWARIPHASVCGGRGRCSTCRIRIISAEPLDAAGPAERATLVRIHAPANVRLACQFRPRHDVTVQPLVPQAERSSTAARYGAAIDGGFELKVAALFVDLRESTRLATGRLFSGLTALEWCGSALRRTF